MSRITVSGATDIEQEGALEVEFDPADADKLREMAPEYGFSLVDHGDGTGYLLRNAEAGSGPSPTS